MYSVNKFKVAMCFISCFFSIDKSYAQQAVDDSVAIRSLYVLSDFEISIMKMGELYLQDKDYKKARGIVVDLIAKNKKVPIMVFIGNTYYYEQKFDSAIVYYQIALDAMPAGLWLKYKTNLNDEIGDCFYFNNDFKSALKFYIKSGSHPASFNNPKYYFKLALTHERLSDFSNALCGYYNLLLLDPGATYIWDKVNEVRKKIATNVISDRREDYYFKGLSDSCVSYFYNKVLPLGNPEKWVKTGVKKEQVLLYHNTYLGMSKLLNEKFKDAISWYVFYAVHTPSRFAMVRNIMGVEGFQRYEAINYLKSEHNHNQESNKLPGAPLQPDETRENATADYKEDLELSNFYYALWGRYATDKEDSAFIKVCYKRIAENFYYLNDLGSSVNYLSKAININRFKVVHEDLGRQHDLEFLCKILRKSFEDISFDINTGQLREWDVDDFCGPLVVSLDSTQTTDKKPHTVQLYLHPSVYSEYKFYPYGITHPEEDWVNTDVEIGKEIDGMIWKMFERAIQGSLYVVEERFRKIEEEENRHFYSLERFFKRDKYISELLSNNNYELPIKELLNRLYQIIDDIDLYLEEERDFTSLMYYKFQINSFLKLYKKVEGRLKDTAAIVPEHIANNFSIVTAALKLAPIQLDTLIINKLLQEDSAIIKCSNANKIACYFNSLNYFYALDSVFPLDPAINYQLARVKGSIGWCYLLEKKYEDALNYSTEAIKIDTSQKWTLINKAHALLFLGRYSAAKNIYEKLSDQEAGKWSRKTFGELILEDVKTFRDMKMDHPSLADLEKLILSRPKKDEGKLKTQ